MTSKGRGGRRKPATVFTEQGVAMLSSVLRTERAILVNVEIMRAFVRLRHLLATNADLARRLNSLEGKYDKQFRVIFDAIRQLMIEPEPPKPDRIGFKTTWRPFDLADCNIKEPRFRRGFRVIRGERAPPVCARSVTLGAVLVGGFAPACAAPVVQTTFP